MADERPQPVDEIYQPPERVSAGAHITSMDDYWAMHARSLNEPEAFWGELANEYIDWIAPFDTVLHSWLRRAAPSGPSVSFTLIVRSVIAFAPSRRRPTIAVRRRQAGFCPLRGTHGATVTP